MLLRKLSAASQSFASKRRLADESFGVAAALRFAGMI